MATVDVVVISPRQRGLSLLLTRDAAARRPAWILPRSGVRAWEGLDDAAMRVCRSALRAKATLIRQVRAMVSKNGSGPAIAIGYLALVPESDRAPAPGMTWAPLTDSEALVGYQRAIAADALRILRDADDPRLPFALLPPRFTLSELQHVCEMVRGRPLHKASFRRTLLAAKLVQPTDASRGEGRGRPARLFRVAGTAD